jgi:Cysteine-rich CWC
MECGDLSPLFPVKLESKKKVVTGHHTPKMGRILKILETVTTIGRQRTCEACGDAFTCGASLSGCWCAEIQLDEETRRDLRTRYSDCLCRRCLESLTSKNQKLS